MIGFYSVEIFKDGKEWNGFSWLRIGQVAGVCKGKETLGFSIQCVEFVNLLSY